MKLEGSATELVSVQYRKDSQLITLRPSQTVTYTAARDVQLPPQDAASILVSTDATQTLSNKSISGSSNTITNVSLTAGVTGILPTANGGTAQNSTATFPTSGIVGTVPSLGVVHSNGTVLSASNVNLTSEVTGALPIANGGTSQITATLGFGALAPTTTKGDLIVSNGTANIRLAVGADGLALVADSAQTSGLKYAAVLSNPMTTLGDIIYENSSPAPARLAGNTTTTNKFLTQVGNGTISAAPAWNAIAGTDLPAVTSLSDAVATAQGSKTYSHGTSYNGGNAPTITLVGGGGTLSSVAEGDFIPYQMQDGSWRCIFNITVAVSATARSQLELNVNGITFFDTGGGGSYGPAVSSYNDGGLAFINAYLENNNGRMTTNHVSTATSKYSFSCDARLASKPTWAY